MTRRIGLLGLALILAWLSLVCAPPARAAGLSVRVSATADPVRINGQLIDNAHTRYPFVSYNGITYLPLTWENTRALGLQLEWDETAGLLVYPVSASVSGTFANGRKWAFQQDLSANRALPAAYTASVVTYPISVGFAAIDNAREEYPFLEYQNIVYMPMTWHIVHDLLRLTVFWDPANGLNVIGDQQPVLGRIVYDDADHLYIASFVSPAIHNGSLLKLNKTLAEKPVWISEKETQAIRERMKRQREDDPYRGKAIPVDIREDGLYYGGLKLLVQAETIDPSNTSLRIEFSGTSFELDGNRSLLAIRKKNSSSSFASLTDYLFLYADGKATRLEEFPQVPAKVIPNADGSYWLGTYSQAVHGHMLLNTLRLAHLDADGKLRVMNQEWNSLSVQLLGLGHPLIEYGDPGFADPLTADGQIYVQLGSYSLERERPMVEAGIYSVDPDFKLTRISESPPESAQVYESSDKQLYTLGERVNTIRNLSSRQTGMWYDYEMLEAQ